MKQTYLKATLQKDYYRKAVIFEDSDFIVLRSYDTDVVAIDKSKNEFIRLWAGWSSTTSKHIDDFLMLYGFKRLSKKEWLALPCINPESVYNICISNGFICHTGTAMLTESEATHEIERIYEQNTNRSICCDMVEV
jgi:hypothetical protein